jgi:hypothetical protein
MSAMAFLYPLRTIQKLCKELLLILLVIFLLKENIDPIRVKSHTIDWCWIPTSA